MPIRIRRAKEDDARIIWQWRNDPYVREQSLSEARIPWKDHCVWFQKKLASSGTRIWILSYQGRSAAVARYDRRTKGAVELSFFVGPSFRGKGLGRAVVAKTIPLLRKELKAKRILAKVKEDNVISSNLLSRLGFEKTRTESSKGFRCIHMKKGLS